MKKIFILLIVSIVFSSRNMTQQLHDTGTYTIKDRDGNITQFYEVNGIYNIVSDTLKKNDKIVVNVIRAHPYRRTARMKPDLAVLQ